MKTKSIVSSVLLAGSLGVTTQAVAAPCPSSIGYSKIVTKGSAVQSTIGNATTEVRGTPDGQGCYRHYQSGSVYWHPNTEAYEVHGLIRQKWSGMGWERSFLGYPTSDERTAPDGVGRYSMFQGGTVLWHPSVGTFEVHGDIRAKFWEKGGEAGLLGYPTTDETVTPDGVGRYNHFQHGSVYWKPSIGAHEIHGLIRSYWAANGWERNAALGYPISDELPTKAGSANRYTDFENGVLFWKSGNSAANLLSRLTLGGASQTKAEVEQQLRDAIRPMFSDSQTYLSSDPYILEVTDYSRSGNTVRNRQYKVRIPIKYHASFLGLDGALPDPSTKLDIWIEIRLNKASGNVEYVLRQWHANTHVPFPTSIGISASTINNRLRSKVDPLMNQANFLKSIPGGINILSLKVQKNGDIDTYMEPLF